ncbi:MAG: hypothetical protein HOP02_16600 [Methylococcaceae bacterium]|nr:hypothetical protein [Methylococcaceae bacterium]
MHKIGQWGEHIIDFWRSLKDDRLSWRINNQAQQQQLKHLQALSEHDLAGQLKTRSVQLEYELAALKTTHQTQMNMLKTKCRQDIKDYKQYLAALDQLKIAIQTRYPQLPDVVAFTIHHHAKQLLNAMWEAETVDEKMQQEMQLIRLMTTVQEDARLYLNGDSPSQLPEKTLQLLQRK